jgi:hypothetical protein
MKILFSFLLVSGFSFFANAQTKAPLTLKEVLLNQLRATHNKAAWYAPLNVSIAGLSAEQANWKEKGADHSIAELTTHIIFWNQNLMNKFLNQPTPKFSGDNKETFAPVDKDSWPATVKKADSLMSSWEAAIEAADDKKLQAWYESIANMSVHNAYHTGQIVYIRKIQGSWDPDKGVK